MTTEENTEQSGAVHQALAMNRITAATLITLAAAAVSRLEGTEEGTPSRRTQIPQLEKSFNDLDACSARNRTDDPALSAVLDRLVGAYRQYMKKHEAAERSAKGEPAVFKAACAAGDKSLEELDGEMSWGLTAL